VNAEHARLDQRGTKLAALIQGGPSAVEDFCVSRVADEGPT
jgi:hypothetical protein